MTAHNPSITHSPHALHVTTCPACAAEWRVPEWVHMAEVPPPVDEEPWIPAPDPAPRRSRAPLAALLLLALIAVVVWWVRLDG